ncbi:hypothetical protein FJT64_008063 [Amphibalanus amphitrite]|uniref:Uncharacterized protein n=1 Tax=Amphibalanus amphitrite TaxID=1232801 RepID=A0A6A4VMQ6_AMPAM|nr:hypothetical protein FJT64_008063 [Amphibalanus amphitrite]
MGSQTCTWGQLGSVVVFGWCSVPAALGLINAAAVTTFAAFWMSTYSAKMYHFNNSFMSFSLDAPAAATLTEESGPSPARLRALHSRYCAAVSAVDAFNSVLALPALLITLSWFVLAASLVTIGSARRAAGAGQDPLVLAQLLGTLVQALGHGAALCWAGQRLEEAARRPAELLLRAAPAGAWADQLVRLVELLRPALSVPGLLNINSRLLLSVTVGFGTYTVVLLQMI